MRFLLKLVLCFLLALAAGFGYLALRSGDAFYSVYEWLSPARFQQYDPIISAVAAEHRLDPMLVKAVAWRESRFDTHKVGTTGERGLMQVSAKAANEWAQQNKIADFQLGPIVRSENKSRSRIVVFAARAGSLAKRIGTAGVCACGIQCRREPRSTLGRRGRHHHKPVSRQHRIPDYAKLRAIDYEAVCVLQAPRADVIPPNVSNKLGRNRGV